MSTNRPLTMKSHLSRFVPQQGGVVMNSRTGPLVGMRVLDLSRGMPGAVATMILADYGAEVVVVERPGGTPLRRTGAHSVWNRGKRSLVADLGDPDDVAVLAGLAAGADVVI